MSRRGLFWAGTLVVALIAALAAVSNDREYATSHSQPSGPPGLEGYPDAARHAFRKLVRIGSDATPALLVLTVGLGALAIRRHPGTRRSWPSRGRAALLAANLGLGWGLANYLVFVIETPAIRASYQNYDQFQYHATHYISPFCPAPIVGAWAVLAYAGHWWRRRGDLTPDGAERAGCLVGWAWLGWMVLSWFELALD